MDIKIILSFLFGFLSSLLIEKIKNDLESITLIDLFRRDFKLSWYHLSSAKNMPNSDMLFSGTFEYRGVKGLSISGVDTYLVLPIHNSHLFEIEGPKLVKYLKKGGRDRFWKIYLLSKDIEIIRIKLLNKEFGDNDNEYRKIIRTLILNLYQELNNFEQDLRLAYPFLIRIKRYFQS
ncbi:hypothetical protein [Photobacterium toruni]|uniref:Uncharacterized protein n=1 Tax=Photobacterium toruni TaxID=1935446 RepID=A0A1T4PQG4_9GAMM|nr:hypothetical protein [Photobacterium toruni]SJZ93649.1 hypothetical protein CZ814_00844 [Photobacterium toruni]